MVRRWVIIDSHTAYLGCWVMGKFAFKVVYVLRVPIRFGHLVVHGGIIVLQGIVLRKRDLVLMGGSMIRAE